MLLSQIEITNLYQVVNDRLRDAPHRLEEWLEVFDEEAEKRGYMYNFSLGCTCPCPADRGHFAECCLTTGVK